MVHPSFSKVSWCSGRTRGTGAWMSCGLVSCSCSSCESLCFEVVFFFMRRREIMFEMEDWCSDDLGDSVVVGMFWVDSL